MIRWLRFVVCCWALWWGPGVAVFAQQDAGEAQGLRIECTEDGLYLGASFDFTLPDLAEDALHKGIPMFFVMEAQVRRDRWYWSDRVVAEATRYLRLSYQPLTRRWRLSTSSVPFTNSGLGVVLGQNFDELDEALSAMRRVIRWLRFVVCCWALWWAPGAAVFAPPAAGDAQGLRKESKA